MSVTREQVLEALRGIALPGGGDPVSRDMVRALGIAGGDVRFVLEAGADEATALEPVRAAAEAAVTALPGVTRAQVALTSPAPGQKPAQPGMKFGGHPTREAIDTSGIARILAIASGKGGVGKSTLSSNLAVALARQGRRVGLLDADIHGPSQPRMMGLTGRPSSPDGKTILPLHAHGVTVMSVGLMMKEGEAAIWRGPMLMGAIQQMLGQVLWGPLDVLVVDLPPGTGDVQLTLCQKTKITGAIIVSTPQDVALIDAARAINMFERLEAPILGLVENMSSYCCPNCGHEAHLFGHGGVAAEAERRGLPFLGEIPISLEIRLAGDAGTPVATGDGPMAEAYARLAARLIASGLA
ncbi:MAG: sodium:proton antiporter [Alphaproteobacteria bacterium HGW-Alphaproteobacteria-2]|nr:MAG: sodium:proton antiporter [Alphaproteobacteria bacterium HGW-Alphaproteobacteria-2]